MSEPTKNEKPPLHKMPGFIEWRFNPVTVELLARVEASIARQKAELEKFKPCGDCGAEKPGVNGGLPKLAGRGDRRTRDGPASGNRDPAAWDCRCRVPAQPSAEG